MLSSSLRWHQRVGVLPDPVSADVQRYAKSAGAVDTRFVGIS